MKNLSKLIVFFVFTCALFFNGCTLIKKNLTVVTSATLPPWSQKEESSELPTGLDIDLMNLIAEKINANINFQIKPFSNLLSSVSDDKNTIAISAISVTDQRKLLVDFSDQYFSGSGQVLVTKSENSTFNGLSKSEIIKLIPGVKIAVQSGTIGESYALSLGGILNTFSDSNTAIQSIINSENEAFLVGYNIAKALVEENSEKIKLINVALTTEQYGVAINKDNSSLLEEINNAISKLKTEGKLEELYTKYGVNS